MLSAGQEKGSGVTAEMQHWPLRTDSLDSISAAPFTTAGASINVEPWASRILA